MNFNLYKEQFHFSINFFSVFLLVTFIPDVFGWDNQILKYTFWVIKVLFAVWIITKNKVLLYRFTPAEGLFMVVAFIYLANLYVDIFVDPLPILTSSRGLADFMGFCIGILIALSFRHDAAFYSKKSFEFFWVSLTAGLVLAYFLAVESSDSDALSGRFDANSTINTIMYGQSGCALALISIYGMLQYKKPIWRILFLVTLGIGLLSIAKAGTRSPLLILALVSLFLFISKMGTVKGVLLVAVLAGATFVFMPSILNFLDSIGSPLGNRFINMYEEGESSGRDMIYEHVVNLIKEAPFFGNYYIIPSGIAAKSYPHNFFLEAFMATGFVGGIPFLILVLVSIIKSFKILASGNPSGWFALIYLQIICYGMFSTSLYSSQEFWTLLFFIASYRFQTATITQANVASPPLFKSPSLIQQI